MAAPEDVDEFCDDGGVDSHGGPSQNPFSAADAAAREFELFGSLSPEPVGDEDDLPWVQCDACEKWHVVSLRTMQLFSGDAVFRCSFIGQRCRFKR